MAATAKRDGWDVVKGTAKYTYSGRAATTTLVAATRNGSYVLVVVSVVGQTYQKAVDKVLASLRFAAAPATAPTVPATAPAPPATTKVELSGTWGFCTGGALELGHATRWLRDSRQYTFDGKGKYTFLRRHDVNYDPDSSVTREHGTYTLTGDVLTVTPAACERELWSKPKGTLKSAYEKLLKREKLPLEKATYRVGYMRDEDGVTDNLVLTPSAATQRDGGFNSTTRYRLFPPNGKHYTAIPPPP